MPFREAHAVVGAHVRAALAGEGSLGDLVAADPALGRRRRGVGRAPASVCGCARRPAVRAPRRSVSSSSRIGRCSPTSERGSASEAARAATWFERDADVVAPDCSNKLLVSRDGRRHVVAGRIVEVEAYAERRPGEPLVPDGRTPRNQVMFGPAGHLYVYVSYGIHRCANVVTGVEGDRRGGAHPCGRAAVGIDVMRSRRGVVKERDLANGPGKVCQAFGDRPRRLRPRPDATRAAAVHRRRRRHARRRIR